MACVELSNISLDYPIYSASGRSLKSLVSRRVGGKVDVDDGSRVSIHSLNQVSLHLKDGDRLAILGGNGAGKSTLLKVLSSIFEPPSGMARIEGKISSLLDYSMGMDPEATGYENIFMRAVFLGASFDEARAIVPDVEAFCELGDYLSFPLRTYSSGMVVRLSFAISTAVPPEILIMDEQVGAGDAAFAAKAMARLHGFIHQAKILIFATHDMGMAKSLCNRAIVMKQGTKIFDGSIDDGIDTYKAG